MTVRGGTIKRIPALKRQSTQVFMHRSNTTTRIPLAVLPNCFFDTFLLSRPTGHSCSCLRHGPFVRRSHYSVTYIHTCTIVDCVDIGLRPRNNNRRQKKWGPLYRSSEFVRGWACPDWVPSRVDDPDRWCRKERKIEGSRKSEKRGMGARRLGKGGKGGKGKERRREPRENYWEEGGYAERRGEKPKGLSWLCTCTLHSGRNIPWP